MKLLLHTLLFVIFCQSANAQQPSFIGDSLDQYIQKGMNDWQIPGLAISIVKDGKVIYSKGFGERNLTTHAPVTEHTLFMIASNTKLFTGTAIAQLAYNKKLSLDDKITRYFSDFKMYDSLTTKQVTIRDMLSHRVGTKTFQGDFTFWNGKIGRREIMQKMRLLQPTGIFRQDFGYCNSCYLTAGEIIPVVTGKPWEVYVYDSLLIPLGMKNTHTLVTGMNQRPNVAKPYTTAFTGKITELPYDQVDNLGPAGSMVSSVHDLSKWLIMQLDSGRYEGKSILPWSVVQKTRDINIALSSRKNAGSSSHFTGYGLGLFMTDYLGKQVFWHTGGAFGFVSNTCLVPEAKLGIVILTNNDNQSFFEILRHQILDAYLGAPFVDKNLAGYKGFQIIENDKVEQLHRLEKRVIQMNAPPLPFNAYSGKFPHPVYGNIMITKENRDLVIQFEGHRQLSARLQYMDNEEWRLSYSNPAFGIFTVTFKTQQQQVQSIDIPVNDFLEYDPYTFRKQ
ncbi:MAG: serine hydrolase [Chitinophagaceae bacterium]|nr:serine hydrolase [Chitinophagaceae bacterium]